jgi:hypothetical protein
MMALLTVEYLEAAMGGAAFTDAENAQAQFYIDKISSWIEEYTNYTFGLVEDETHRYRSDDYGVIELPRVPVTDVSKVHDFRNDIDLISGASYFWDGIVYISGLYARHVYDVTYSYGLETVPLSIKTIATEACKRGMATAPSGLKQLTVGDITENYGDMLDFSPEDKATLDNYVETEGTIRLNAGIDSPGPGYSQYGVVLNGPSYDYWGWWF